VTNIVHRLTVLSHRQAAHDETQNFGYKLMCRLAAPSCPPSGFWAKTQNFVKTA